MKTLVGIPGKPQSAQIDVFEGRVPKPEEVVLLPQGLIKASVLLGGALKDMPAKWAIGGDAGETLKNVRVKSTYIEIWTTKEGCDEACEIMSQYVTLKPALVEKKLTREADYEGKMYPIFVKSHYAELTIDKTKVEVYGDQQIKVGEWDWGDPLDFEPEYLFVLTARVPVVPLRLKQELDLGLGWTDRLELIAAALYSAAHHLADGGGAVRPKSTIRFEDGHYVE